MKNKTTHFNDSRTMKGMFKPVNPAKYEGDASNIIYRSSWEFSYMARLDTDKNVVKWSSEETVILYTNPFDNSLRRYFPDFKVTKKDDKGELKTFIVEIKPLHQSVIPKKQGKTTKKFLKEASVVAINHAKWEAAKRYCAQRGYEFLVLTEKELKI